MADNTITRAHLSEAVYQEVGLSRNESADLVESVLNEVAESLAKGETVKISSFGSFSVRQKGQRVGRNPKTEVRDNYCTSGKIEVRLAVMGFHNRTRVVVAQAQVQRQARRHFPVVHDKAAVGSLPVC